MPTRRDRRRAVSLRWRMRTLRIGGGWSAAGALTLFMCWLAWAGESGLPQMTSSLLVLLLIFGIAVGLFALSRLVGNLILERWLGRLRRNALVSHIAIGVFLGVAGLSLLGQVQWVVEAMTRLRGGG